MEHLYERIRSARERAGFSVNEAAERLGVSRVQVWRMENKSETISAERLFLIAKIYGVDPIEIYHGTDAASQNFGPLYRQIGEVVAMVEAEVQRLEAKPSPDVVGEAVVEVLRQEMKDQNNSELRPFDGAKYQGLIALLIKQASK